MELKLFIEAGLVDPDDVIAWADDQIALIDDYVDELANVAIARGKGRTDMSQLLAPLAYGADEFEAMRVTMARMHEALVHSPERAHEFATVLESFWIGHRYNVPPDMTFFAGVEDSFQLAELGAFGSVQSATDSLLKELKKFRKGTEPGG